MRGQIQAYNFRVDFLRVRFRTIVCMFERLVSTLKGPVSMINIRPFVAASVAQGADFAYRSTKRELFKDRENKKD